LIIGLAVFCAAALCGTTAAASPAANARLKSALGQGVSVARHAETKKVRFIGTSPGSTIDRPAGVPASASAQRIATAFLDRHGQAFGIADPGSELRVDAKSVEHGRSTVRFQQVHRGVRVLGGELVVNLDQHGNVLSANGEVEPNPSLSMRPQVTSATAVKSTRAMVAKHYSIAAKRLEVTRPGLWIYDSRLLGGPGLERPTLVWRMEVTDDREPVRELVLIDARRGNIVLNFDQIAEARNREVCDAANSTSDLPCTNADRVEGDPPSPIADVNRAYDYAGDTYDFFSNRFGRDSLDGAGMTLLSTTRYCPSTSNCPYANAYWDGSQAVFGQGYTGDDAVAHELTHGVTEFTSGLYYYYQSGAIDESLSDVFGEFVDLTNGAGTDTAVTRWQHREDYSGGPNRDLQDPTLFGDPDRMTSSNYAGNQADNGGVHTNSGVNNKAAYLITDGDTFNGRTVTGLGITKAARIYYEADANLLTSGSDYADLFRILPQACTNLIGTVGITAANCAEVKDAVAATEMNVVPPAAPNPEAPTCPAGYGPKNSFFDNMENQGSNNWVLFNTLGNSEWHYTHNYATSGNTSLTGADPATTSDFSVATRNPVTVPTNGFLRFRHAYGFEDDAGGFYDGGILQYSINGTSWVDAGSLFTHNGYDGTLDSGNALGARSAFTAESNGYISSRVNLASLAGQGIRFRWRIGTDSTVGNQGWFLDDVRIYRCLPALRVNDVTVTEGDAGTRLASFTVTRGTGTGTSSVNYATANGSAVAPGDYTTKSGTLTFTGGQTQKTVSVVVKGDTVPEANETFLLNLSGPSNAVLSDGQGRATILNDD
jgi:Zn-dependent metalloprotease